MIGYLHDTEVFPDMLHTRPSCNEAYQNYLTVAQPLEACSELEEARMELAVQQGIIQHLDEIKGCRQCRKQLTQANEAAAAYQEQIRLYQSHCPNAKSRARLAKKITKREREVCSSCKKNWPGKVGPHGRSPCK